LPRIEYTFGDAKREILANVNDADGDVYGSRVKEVMFEGINMLVSQNEFIPEDIPGMIKREIVYFNELSTSNDFVWSSPINTSQNGLFSNQIIKIININFFQPHGFQPDDSKKYTFHKIDDDYFNKMQTDKTYDPMADEIYYHINRITYPIKYADETINDSPDNFTVAIQFFPREIIANHNEGFKLSFIRSPRPKSWTDDTIMAGYFSMPFIYKVINYATEKIKLQQVGE